MCTYDLFGAVASFFMVMDSFHTLHVLTKKIVELFTLWWFFDSNFSSKLKFISFLFYDSWTDLGIWPLLFVLFLFCFCLLFKVVKHWFSYLKFVDLGLESA